jgi:ABC-2 type transport system permease protein
MVAIIRKELADHFNSVRFFVLFILVLVASVFGLYTAQQGIRAALEQSKAVTAGGFVFLALFTSSFAINSERSGGTMSRLLAQPVYRDSVINGKFLAGIMAIALMVGTTLLLVAGYGLRMIGVPPSAEEIIRLFLYMFIVVVYGAFWMGLSMLFSVVFRRAAGSLLVPLVLFLIFYFFWVFLGLGQVVAQSVSPINNATDVATQIQAAGTQETILRLSPSYLFQQAYVVLLVPMWKGLGAITYGDLMYMLPNTLSLGQCLLAIWPHIVVIISLSAICFGLSYVIFMKQEIRAT